jgi:hypothetical protein
MGYVVPTGTPGYVSKGKQYFHFTCHGDVMHMSTDKWEYDNNWRS